MDPFWRSSKYGAFQQLQIFSIVTALAHAGQASAILAFRKDYKIPTYYSLLAWPNRDNPVQSFTPFKVTTGSVSLEGCIAAFFFLSFAFQFLTVTLFWNTYSYLLRYRFMQPFRFVEYAFSAGLMTIIFGLLVGIQQTDFLVVLYSGMATVMLLGLLQEYMPYFKTLAADNFTILEFLLPHFIGWILFLSIVFVFISRFSLIVNHSLSKPPVWVYGMYASQFVVFGSFGLNQLIQQFRLYKHIREEKKCARIAVQHEAVYVILSLAAKSVLAWLLYVNMLAERKVSF